MKLFIDIGGTHLRSEIHGLAEVVYGEVSSREHDLIGFIEQCLACYPDISFIGISYAGQVYRGEILSSPNITVSNREIKAYLESRYPLCLEIDNDLNCAAMAESRYLHEESVAVLYAGTGLGAAVVERGAVVRGYRNQAFELGHIPYQEAPFRCGCGKNNCLELFASGSGLERWMAYSKKRSYGNTPNLEKLKRECDPLVPAFEHALLYAAATLVTLANPKCMVLGGGIIAENPYLVEMIRKSMAGMALNTALEGLEIVQSELKSAGMEGAKLLEVI